ncbi:MAG: hypothetical protein EOO62_23730, partial [Hymenobacter sp.]
YLLSSLILSLLLPLVALPAAWARLVWPAATAGLVLPAWEFGATAPSAPTAAGPAISFSWPALVLGAYWLGVAWQAGRTVRSLGWLYRLSRRHPRTRLGRGWLVQLPAPSRPAFSFGKYVFLSPAHARLSPAEYAQLLQHEQVHGAQHHSFDLLLAEVINWFFWFNGLVRYLRRELRTVHEYLADAAVTRAAGSRVAYGHLLLKLAAGPLPASLVHPFSGRQVTRRILMLTNPPTSLMQKLRFLFVIPVAALAWLGAAALGPAPTAAAAAPTTTAPVLGRIGQISWRGNTFLSAAQLTEALGLKTGDPYDAHTLEAHLASREDQRDITSRYMNNGYLFFNIEPALHKQPDGTTDLTFTISEGPTARINALTIKGNQKTPSAAILKMLPLHQGELFSRAKLIASQRALAESGLFNPAHIDINPRPNPAAGLVDIEYVVIEK